VREMRLVGMTGRPWIGRRYGRKQGYIKENEFADAPANEGCIQGKRRVLPFLAKTKQHANAADEESNSVDLFSLARHRRWIAKQVFA
jgi:hypothetical protein